MRGSKDRGGKAVNVPADTPINTKEFLDFIVLQKGLALNTRLAYEIDLDDYLEFCLRKKINAQSVELSQLRMYLANLRRQDLSARTIARKVSALRQFYRFLVLEERVERDPTELLSVTVREKRLPKFLTVEEMFALLDAAPGLNESEHF